MSDQYVDPLVSRAKFDREIAEFQSLEGEYRRRGWFLTRIAFPEILVLLAAPSVRPSPIVMGVAFNYANYDAEAPSVRLVDPFTNQPYRFKDLPTPLNRVVGQQKLEVPGIPPDQAPVVPQIQSLMQAHEPDAIPFLCIAGVREYHQHPAHNGDAWELHRASGAGRLIRLLGIVHQYGVAPVAGYGVGLQFKVSLNFGQPPQ